MVSVRDAIKSRRSIRSYKPDDVPIDILKKIFEIAEHSPSSKNTKPWEYYILKGDSKDRICEIVVQEYPKRKGPFRKREEFIPVSSTVDTKNIDDFCTAKVMTNIGSTTFIRQAPILVLVFNNAPYTAGEQNVINEIGKESILAYCVEIQGVSNFIYSVLLSAYELGVSGCWIADINFCRDKIKEFIGTKNDLVAGIVLGYSDTKIPPKDIDFDEESIRKRIFSHQ
jgi:nitroreductase